MYKFGKFISKHHVIVLIVSILLIIPAVFGMVNTRVNYDMLSYLPDDLDTVKGQDILLNEFGKGAFSYVIVENMEDNEVAKLREQIIKVNHVSDAIWYDSIASIDIPKEVLPDKIYDAFNSENSTIIAVFFDSSSSSEETIEAVEQIRKITDKKVFISGISALVVDLKNLCEKEEPIYVAIAVACALLAMMIFSDCWITPILFLINIAMAILYNMGTNFVFGSISYITKALVAVLQLAVTMDYSIFLWHSYQDMKKQHDDNVEAMAYAIKETFISIASSSLTTIAGFLALCFMSYKIGKDLGIVMAKGVVFGLISCVTILPSLILIFDKLISKTMHKSLIPNMNKFSGFITKNYLAFVIIAICLFIPSTIGYAKKPIYYDFTKILETEDGEGINQDDILSIVADMKLKEEYGVSSTHMILCDAKMNATKATTMLSELEKVNGVKLVLGYNSLVSDTIPEEIIPDRLTSILKSNNWQLILVNSEYTASTTDCNNQLENLNKIIKNYDDNAMLIGEAACTKDLISITDVDFKVVSLVSIAFIFVIILFTFKSITLPVILVAIIEFAIFLNLGLTFYTKTDMAFIIPVCISTIQLGSSVDYAILLTSKYKKERLNNEDRKEAVKDALASSSSSIITSAFGMFFVTIGVAIYSEINVISTMCNLLARGAIFSMLAVLIVLPGLLIIFDKVICKTSLDNLKLIKGDATFTKDLNNVTWNANKEDIYYTGETDKEIPVNISIKYYLNENEVTYEQLQGKSGKVTIRFDYTCNQSEIVKINNEDKTIYVPYLIISGVAFNNAKTANITSQNGKVIDDGKNSFVVGCAIPGLKEDLEIEDLNIPTYFEISMDAVDFNMDTTFSVATNQFMNGINSNDIKDEKQTTKVNTLCLMFAKEELLPTVNEVVKSLDEYNDYYKGVIDYTSGVDQMDQEIKAGNLEDKLQELLDGSKKLNDGTIKLNTELQEFYENTLKDILEKYNNDFTNMVERICIINDVIAKYQMFTSVSRDMIGKTTYIYTTK